MFERLTDRAREVVVLAQEESRREGHLSIDVGHVGLAALTVSGGAGLDEERVVRVREALLLTLADQTVDHGYTDHVPFTGATKDVFERSLGLSVRFGRNYIASRDLLMAALADPGVSTVLASAGVDLDEIDRVITASAADSEDLLPGEVHDRTPVLGPDPNQGVTELLAQILQRLDTIIDRLGQPDRR